MRRATAGACRRRIGIGSVRRRNGAIRDNDGRSVVAATERHARNVELGASVSSEIGPGRPPRLGSLGCFVLDVASRREEAKRIREAARKAGIAKGERPSFLLV